MFLTCVDSFRLNRQVRGGCREKRHQQPGLPVSLFGDALKQPVIVALMLDDKATQIKNRNIEQAHVEEIKQVQNASATTVAIGKRMDGFEVIVSNVSFPSDSKPRRRAVR